MYITLISKIVYVHDKYVLYVSVILCCKIFTANY